MMVHADRTGTAHPPIVSCRRDRRPTALWERSHTLALGLSDVNRRPSPAGSIQSRALPAGGGEEGGLPPRAWGGAARPAGGRGAPGGGRPPPPAPPPPRR